MHKHKTKNIHAITNKTQTNINNENIQQKATKEEEPKSKATR